MSLTVFAADDGTHGRELWRTDGTAAGTMLLKDIVPGSAGSAPHDFAPTSTGAYFIVGAGLWHTDGTASATFLLDNFPNIANLTSAGDRLFFRTYTSNPNTQLWTSDGTAIGTMPIYTGNGSSSPYNITNLIGVGSTLFFNASNPQAGTELWSSDGTAAGTRLVRDIAAGTAPSYPSEMTVVGTRLFFTADDGVNGRELWMADASSGQATLVRDIAPGSSSSNPTGLTSVDGRLYFRANNGPDGPRVWTSDGTAAGTIALSADAVIPNPSGTRYVAGTDVGHGTELWTRTGAATAFLADINPLTDPSPSFIGFDGSLAVVGGRLIFNRNDGESSRFGQVAHGRELWVSDGTAAGTMLLKDINPSSYVAGIIAGGTIAYGSSNPANFTNYNGQLYFSADNQNGRELWRTDGTASGTLLVSDILPGSASSNPTNLVNAGQLYFLANDGQGSALYRSDGTAQGTVVVHASGSGFAPSNLIATASGLSFTSGSQVWRSDGTTQGTTVVADLAAAGSSAPTDLQTASGAITFRATGAGGAAELWTSDGTASGTYRINVVAAGERTGIANLTDGNGALYFTASTPSAGLEIWRTDASGTALLRDINPGAGSSGPANLAFLNNRLYFTANDGSHGTELWVSDGTGIGTRLLDIAPGAASSSPASLSAVGGLVYFTAATAASGREVWRTDGSSAGTVQVSETQTAFSSDPDGFTTPAAAAITSRPDLFGAVTHDPGSVAGRVYELYDGLLGRAPDPLGLEGWTANLRAGASLQGVAQAFLASPEGQARAGALNSTDFVQQLYGATLHRTGEAAGVRYWGDQLDHGASRADVALGFALSSEHIANLQGAFDTGIYVSDTASTDVARVYYGVLGRAPDAGGLAAEANLIRQGASLHDIVQGFLGSGEYAVRFGSPDNSRFVDALYEHALGRSADTGSLQYWSDTLSHGASRANVAIAITQSAEAHQHLLASIEAGWNIV